jgi:hypothetical protein
MRHLNENQIFQYNGSPITFQKGDSVMVNATEMAKPFGKRCNDFLSTKQTKELISSLSAKTGISATGLVTVNQGGNNQGTWMHEDVALEFLSTLSAVRIIPLTGLVDKAFKKILFSFGSLRNCCTFAVLTVRQTLLLRRAAVNCSMVIGHFLCLILNDIRRLSIRSHCFVLRGKVCWTVSSVYGNRFSVVYNDLNAYSHE